MYKKVVTPANTTEEYYLMDAFGKTLAIENMKVSTNKWTYYLVTNERDAQLKPTDSSVQFNYGEATFFLYDHLGNTRVSYSKLNDGLVVHSLTDYFPYGKILREYVSTRPRYLTTQHERDTETDLDYRGARYYDSEYGRFLSVDPLAAKYPSISSYAYVAGNPVIYIDPDGRRFKKASDEEKANKMIAKIEKRLTQIESELANTQKQLEELEASMVNFVGDNSEIQHTIDLLKNSIKNLTFMSNEMKDGIREINEMKTNTDIVYQVKKGINIPFGSDGYTTVNKQNEVVIKFKNYTSASHEFKHGYQYISGDLSVKSNDYKDINDEIMAYRRDYAFNPNQRVYSNLKNYEGINGESVRRANEEIYKNLPSENLKTH